MFAICLALAMTAATEPAASAPPLSVGTFRQIFEPKAPYCLNDHTFIKGPDGLWHMFGITHVNPIDFFKDPGNNLAHATAKTLRQEPWDEQPFAVTADAKFGEYLLWAPHVFRVGNIYHMYVCVGAKQGHEYAIHHLTSKDLWKWDRDPNNPVVVDGFDGRDPMVIRDGKRWIMYYTANTEVGGGNHVVSAITSPDLKKWSKKQIVFTHSQKGTFGGPTESPFVVRRGKRYYLFITDGGTINVFASNDPLKWTMADKVCDYQAHASEVIRDETGKWYVSHVGWMWGGLSVARLMWNDGLDDESTSLDIAD